MLARGQKKSGLEKKRSSTASGRGLRRRGVPPCLSYALAPVRVCARDMGNGCARTWVTPKRHAEPPAGGGQDALAGGYPDVVARGVCAVGAASGSEQARAVPAL